jgi:hypothetical protein
VITFVALFERVSFFQKILETFLFLKEGMKKFCAKISEEICENVANSLHFRINYCVTIDGKKNFKNEN